MTEENRMRKSASISPDEAAALQSRDDVIFIDLRETDEYAGLRMESRRPGQVRLMPLSILPYLPQPEDTEKTAVFFCRSGRRTTAHQDTLEALGYAKTLLLDKGLEGWREAGLPVQSDKQPMPLMRQVQIAAGALVILLTLIGQLTVRTAPDLTWAAWLPVLAGAGLIFAGASGFCGLAVLLGKMPWNRRR